jgi:para-nitrobenzyl esterase
MENAMQVVKTDKGYISGTAIGEPGKEISIFRGIPYAAPPVGEFRWKPPQPVKPWKGIRECTQMSAISPQVEPEGMVSGFALSEDCLYLNVLTPAKQPDEKLPVLVWMHGGGYASGCGNDRIWNNSRLPQHGAVVVTLTHRLGPIGLFAHEALSKESPKGVSGNYLFLDLIASLKWIQKNIAAFGGDPDNVTIFGESGGGAKVAMMLLSPLAKGLFHKAICESGTVLAILLSKPLADLENYGKKLFKKLGIDSSDDPLAQARSLPFSKIVAASQAMEATRTSTMPPSFIWDAAVDGWLLPDHPRKLFASGCNNPVPLLVSANMGELTGPGPLTIPILVPAYMQMLKSVIKQGHNGYAFIFDQVPAVWRKQGGVSVHSIELPYVFGDWDNSTGWWNSITMFIRQLGVKTAGPVLGEVDRYVSEKVMELWVNFAKDGKPSAKGVPKWPEYKEDSNRYMYVHDKFELKAGFSKVAQ